MIEVVTADTDLRATVKGFCDREEISLISASSPENATALAQRHRPDCILVDAETISDVMAAVVIPLKKGVTEKTPIILVSNDTRPVYDEQAELVAARLRRSFTRKTFLHSVRYAMDPQKHRGVPAGKDILVVDDDPEVIDFVTRCLSAEGYVVNGAANGNEVLDRVRAGSYGLVLLDVAMPGFDGWQVCSQIKGDAALSDTRVYMVTARPKAEVEAEVNRCGADGYILKPFRAEDLTTCVAQVMPPPAQSPNDQ
jgi:DNA-binding response OmpR family regulator